MAQSYIWFSSAVAFAISMSATPGPNNTMVTSSGATFGFTRTIPHILGISFGFPAMLIAIALGAGELLRSYPWIEDVMKWIGIAYLLWLAWRIASTHPKRKDMGGKNRRKPLTFIQAVLFQWVNPKAWIIALSAIVTYTTKDNIFSQSIELGIIFLIACLFAVSFWTSMGVGAAKLLRSERALWIFNLAMAGLLVASLVPMIMGE